MQISCNCKTNINYITYVLSWFSDCLGLKSKMQSEHCICRILIGYDNIFEDDDTLIFVRNSNALAIENTIWYTQWLVTKFDKGHRNQEGDDRASYTTTNSHTGDQRSTAAVRIVRCCMCCNIQSLYSDFIPSVYLLTIQVPIHILHLKKHTVSDNRLSTANIIVIIDDLDILFMTCVIIITLYIDLLILCI